MVYAIETIYQLAATLYNVTINNYHREWDWHDTCVLDLALMSTKCVTWGVLL